MRLIWFLVLTIGCVRDHGDGSGGAGDDDDDDTTGACAEDLDCPDQHICDEGTCVLGDRDNALEEATELLLSEDDENAVDGVIAPAGDIDWYVYEADAPQWVSVRTTTLGDRAENLDTVLAIWNADGDLHTAIDNYPTGLVTGYDSVLYAWLPEAGSWYVTVEDVTTWYTDVFAEEEWRGGEDFEYSVLVRQAYGVGETDSAGEPGASVELEDGGTIFSVGVLLESPGDVDHIALDNLHDGGPLEVWGHPSLEGSSAAPLVRLYDPDGAQVAEKWDIGLDGYISLFSPVVGTYRVEATTQDGHGADDAWFVLYMRSYEADASHPFFGTTLYELEVEPNDGAAQATQLTREERALSDGDVYYSHFLEGDFADGGDADFYLFEGLQDEYASVRCWTDKFGSLADPVVSVMDAGGNVLTPAGQGADPVTDDYYVWDLQIPSDGLYRLLMAPEGGSGGPGAYYRCAVYLTPWTLNLP